MALSLLPVDGLRPILAYLDAEQLVSLYCTFDRRIMQIMSFPGAVPRLRLDANVRREHVPLLRHFVQHIRNVTYLSLEDGEWAPLDVSLLLSLNPIRLLHDVSGTLESKRKLLISSASALPSANQGLQASFLQPNGLPDFARLTTRLETLKLIPISTLDQETYSNNSVSISLPPTLTSLRGTVCCNLLSLPLGLRSLSLSHGDLDLNKVFSMFPRLEKLLLDGATLKHEKPVVFFPETLTHLRINKVIETDDSADLAFHPPGSVTRLDLTEWTREVTTYQLSTGLRVLNLLHVQNTTKLQELSLLTSLEKFSLKGPISVSAGLKSKPQSRIFYLASLPPSVKSINVDCYYFQSLSGEMNGVTPRLAALESLIAQFFYLDELNLLHQYAPRCRAYFEMKYNRHSDNLVHTLREFRVIPTEDLRGFVNIITAFNRDSTSDWELTMRCGCVQEGTNRSFVRRVFVTNFFWLDLESMLDHCGKLHMCTKTDSMELRGVAPYKSVLTPPHSLTHMDLHSATLSLNLYCLPKTLTRLSTKATFKVVGANDSTSQRGWPCTQMKHLDTPNGSFMLHHFGDLRGLDVFKATVVNVADYNVMNWLTTAVAPKTRRNMSISMTYYITGAAVPDGDVDGLKDVTWSSICAWTTETLKRALASPWAISELSGTPSDDNGHDTTDNSIDTDTIGRVINSFHVSGDDDPYDFVCFPSSAARITLNEKREIDLLPDMKLLPIEIDGSRVQFRASSESFESLLKNAFSLMDRPTPMLQVFRSLRFIHVSNLRVFPDLRDFSMPNLEVLILKRAQTSESSQFAFASLPTSLQTLALLGTSPWTLESSIPSSFTLPNLSAALFENIPSSDLRMQVWKALTKSPLKRFEVVETRTKQKQTYWAKYGIKIVDEISLDGLV